MRRFMLMLFLVAASGFTILPASAQPFREGVAERIAQAAQMADAWRRCSLPSDQPFPNFEELWAKEVARTRTALKERLALPDADVETLMAPMLQKAEPLPDSMPMAEAKAICNAAGEWMLRTDKLMASSYIEKGDWAKPKPLFGAPRADDAAVLEALTRTLDIWRITTSCDVLSQTMMAPHFRNWERMRENAAAELKAKRFDLSPQARIQIGLMLDFSYQLEPARGTLGELRQYCAKNAETIAKARDPKSKMFVFPENALKALQPAPKANP